MNDAELYALATQLGEKAKVSHVSLATAESCTAGGISYTITQVAGSSQWFDRGWVTYTNKSKQELLGVKAETLAKFGAVSKECASEMVQGALQRSPADWAVAVTGIAGPGGAVPGKPVGTVYLAWCSRNTCPEVVCEVFPGDRQEVRIATIQRALQGLIDRITKK